MTRSSGSPNIRKKKKLATITVRNFYRSLLCCALTTRELLVGVCHAAKSGRLLPRLTLIAPFHAFVHWFLFESSASSSCSTTSDDASSSAVYARTTCEYWKLCSLRFMTTNIVLNLVGYTILVILYRHSVRTIFNCNIPSTAKKNEDDDGCRIIGPHPAVRSFNVHLLLLRPLEILFRFVTAPLRVLPDAIVIGETRCGTTNLCGHLTSLSDVSSSSRRRSGRADRDAARIRVYTPFCAWAHPVLDRKESFYFVGHYLGVVDPLFYRMAFPLKITRWWEENVRGNLFLCFDGCAQYLTSPTAPYLIASAYRNAADEMHPPALVACVRDPVDQAVSWWKYENNAISWAESIGLTEPNAGLRSARYPPRTVADALEFSGSDFVRESYANAEKLAVASFQNDIAGRSSNRTATASLLRLFTGNVQQLPPWAMTWPAGQLSAIGRSCNYAKNIKRYNDVFSTAFGGEQSEGSNIEEKSKSKKRNGGTSDRNATNDAGGGRNRIGLVNVIPLECQSDGPAVASAMRPVLEQCVRRGLRRRKLSYDAAMLSVDDALDRLRESFEATRRNSLASLSNSEREPTREDVAMLRERFEKETEWYSSHAAIHTQLNGSG